MKYYTVYLKTGVHNIEGKNKADAIQNAIDYFQMMLNGDTSEVDEPEFVAFEDHEPHIIIEE